VPSVVLAEAAPVFAARLPAPARNDFAETRILDMSQLGVQGSVTPAEAPPAPPPTLLERLRAHRTAAYALVGVAIVLVRVGAPRPSRAAALAHANKPAASASAQVAPPPSPRVPAYAEPLPPGYEPSPKRAGDWYATGDYVHALREYRGLAAEPGADPVFAIVAHALERRLEHPEAKR
jgi:hypothetical protein